MKILFYYRSMKLGGQQTHNFHLIKRLNEKGHELHWVYRFGEEMKKRVAPFANVYQIPIQLKPKDYLFRPWRLLQISRELTTYCKEHKIDVVISGCGQGSLISGLAARWLGIKHYRIVGCSLIQAEQFLYRYYRLLPIDRLIDGYLSYPGILRELADKDVPETKLISFNNAVDTETFYPFDKEARNSIRAKLGIAEDQLVIGWIGRLAENMQVGNTVRLGRELRKAGFHNFRLLIVGGGPWYEGLVKLIEECDLSDHVIMTDWVPMEEVNTYINAMDIVPLLEEDPRGGSIVREAMACGRVAISVDGESGTQRLFMRPEATILLKPDDFLEQATRSVLSLAQSPAEMERLGYEARKYSEQHMSFEVLADSVLHAIQPRESG